MLKKSFYLLLIISVFACTRKRLEVVLHPVYDPDTTINYRNPEDLTPSSPGFRQIPPARYYQQYPRPASRYYRNPYDFPSARYPSYDTDQYYQAPNAFNPTGEEDEGVDDKALYGRP